MKPKPNSAMNLIKRATQLLTVFLVLSIMSFLGYAQADWTCPCFSEEEFIAMSDGVRDVEPYDEIAQSWEAKEGTGRRWMLAYGGEEGVRGLSWTWVESNEAEGQWCFYEWVHEGYPVERRTILDITDEQFMACYKAIEAECLAQ